MTGNSSAVVAKVKEWIECAEEDLLLARHALTLTSSCPYRLIAYHAHQCAEKYLKAFLVFHLVDFPYTHDIQYLLDLCSQKADWPTALAEADSLTTYSITTRYPGRPIVVKEEVENAIELASQVKSIVRRSLLDEGLIF